MTSITRVIRGRIGLRSRAERIVGPTATAPLPLALLALALLVPVGALLAVWRFDGLYSQDTYAYHDYAVGPLRQSLLGLTLPPPFFWPPGYPALVALLSLMVGPSPLAGQLVSLIGGGLAAVLTALLAAEVWRPRPDGRFGRLDTWLVPLLAGLVTALGGQLWQSSAVVMSDTTGMAAAALGVWALCRYARGGGPGWLVLASLGLSWAILTRWIYALVAVPCAACALAVLRRQGRRTALAHGAAAVAVGAAVVAPMLAPALGGLFHETGEVAPFAGTLQVYSAQIWHPLNALQREFDTAGHGFVQYRLPNGLYYALIPGHPVFFTPLLAPLILPGLLALVRRRALLPIVLIVGWVVAVYGFHAGSTWQNSRYVLSYLPPLAILVAIGAATVYQSMGRRGRWAMVVVLAVGLVWMIVGGVTLTQRFAERKQSDLAMMRWTESQLPPGGRLLTFGPTLLFRHYGQVETLDLFELDTRTLSGLVSEGGPLFALIDVAGVEEQWRDRSPWEAYRWLREEAGLVLVGQSGQYSFFRVGVLAP